MAFFVSVVITSLGNFTYENRKSGRREGWSKPQAIGTLSCSSVFPVCGIVSVGLVRFCGSLRGWESPAAKLCACRNACLFLFPSSHLLTTPSFPKLTFELKVQKVSGLTGVTRANQRPTYQSAQSHNVCIKKKASQTPMIKSLVMKALHVLSTFVCLESNVLIWITMM